MCTSDNSEKMDRLMEELMARVSRTESEMHPVSLDHAYCKPWGSHTVVQRAKPSRQLFMKDMFRQDVGTLVEQNRAIDVVSFAPEPELPFDNKPTKSVFREAEEFVKRVIPNSENIEGDELPLDKTFWSPIEKTLHRQILKVLHSSRMAQLALAEDDWIRRKTALDVAVAKTRRLFSAYAWDKKLFGWLHFILVTNLSSSYLIEYMTIVKTLRSNRVSALISQFLTYAHTYHPHIFTSDKVKAFDEYFHQPCCRSPTGPFLTDSVSRNRPIILILPSSHLHWAANFECEKAQYWRSLLCRFGDVEELPLHIFTTALIKECLNQIFISARKKITEIRKISPKRPIILFGWTVGALTACHVALEVPVTAVICMGFSLKGVNGSRGDLDDPILQSSVPTLFIIGQNSYNCSVDDIEDLRERMKAVTGLVVVGGATDNLRMPFSKLNAEKVTQAMVDKCFLYEVERFLTLIMGPQRLEILRQPSVTLKKMNFSNFQQPKQPFRPISAANSSTSSSAANSSTSNSSTSSAPINEGQKRQRRPPNVFTPSIYDSGPRKKFLLGPIGRPIFRDPISSSTSTDSSSDDYENQLNSKKKSIKGKERKDLPRENRYEHKTPGQRLLESFRAQSKRKLSQMKQPVPKRKELVVKQPIPMETFEDAPKATTTSTTVKKDPARMLAEQQKNEPVDVEKAFGKDCSFLPRPLSPAVFDATPPFVESGPQLVEEPQNIPGGQTSVEAAVSHFELPSSNVKNIDPPVVSIAASSDDQNAPVVSTTSYSIPAFSSAVNTVITVRKPQIAQTQLSALRAIPDLRDYPFQRLPSKEIASSTTATTATNPTSKAVASQPRMIGPTLNFKQIQSLMSSLKPTTSLTTSAGQAKAILMSAPAPGSKRATFLMSTGEGSSKILRHMIVQGPAKLPVLSKLSSATGADPKPSLKAEQVCNLSLLSDVAVMKEPYKTDSSSTTTTSTLVKLTAAGGEPVPTTLKHLKVIEAMPSTSASARVETAEEVAEKQLAVRALSSSLNEDNDSNPPSQEIRPHIYPVPTIKVNPRMPHRSIRFQGLPFPPNFRFKPPPVHNMPNRGSARYPVARKPRAQPFFRF